LAENTRAAPTITEIEEAAMVNELEIDDSGISEEPLANEQVVEPQQPCKENNEPQPMRRSL
jgi:hypothetical protein